MKTLTQIAFVALLTVNGWAQNYNTGGTKFQSLTLGSSNITSWDQVASAGGAGQTAEQVTNAIITKALDITNGFGAVVSWSPTTVTNSAKTIVYDATNGMPTPTFITNAVLSKALDITNNGATFSLTFMTNAAKTIAAQSTNNGATFSLTFLTNAAQTVAFDATNALPTPTFITNAIITKALDITNGFGGSVSMSKLQVTNAAQLIFTTSNNFDNIVVGLGYTPATNGIFVINTPAADKSYQGFTENDVRAGENLAFGDLVYMTTTNSYCKAKADSLTTMPAAAMATETISIGAAGNFLAFGKARSNAWAAVLSPGARIYVSTNTAGSFQTNAPSLTGHVNQRIGNGVTNNVAKLTFGITEVVP